MHDHRCYVKTFTVGMSSPVTDESEVGAEEDEDEVNGNRDNNDEKEDQDESSNENERL
jgi:hypothetical protein